MTCVTHRTLLISGDTGVAHLATASGTPRVILFGPVDPGPLGTAAAHPPPGDLAWRRLRAG